MSSKPSKYELLVTMTNIEKSQIILERVGPKNEKFSHKMPMGDSLKWENNHTRAK